LVLDRRSGVLDGERRFAVFIFFVLSGFVLSKSVAKPKGTLSTLFLARYLRLTVPMLASLIYARILYSLFPTARINLDAIEPQNLWLHKAISGPLPNFMGTLREGLYKVYLTGVSNLNSVVWTMRKELVGSIVIYLLYRFCPKPFQLAAIGIVAAVTLYSTVYIGFPIGAFLFEGWQRGWFRQTKWLWVVTFVLSLGLACEWTKIPLAYSKSTPIFLSFLTADSFYYSLAAGLLIYSIMTNELLRRLLCARVPQFLGRISFAFYLIHFPFLVCVMAWLFLHCPGPDGPKVFFTFVLFIFSAIAIAWLFTISIDEPLMKRLHQLKKINFSFFHPLRNQKSGESP
jgi:peptidoglycan/LPS O-acetylase OafA/YrhL